MPLPQPFQYQASKRALASLILHCSVIWLCAWLFVGCVAPASRIVSSSAPGITTATGTGTNDFAVGPPHKSGPLDSYDNAIFHSIEQKWFDLLDSKQFRLNKTGKVVVRFHLNSDGTISDVKISENHVGELLGYACERAIKDCAPFGKWPPNMARIDEKDYREVTFTFYYYGK